MYIIILIKNYVLNFNFIYSSNNDLPYLIIYSFESKQPIGNILIEELIFFFC